jgi:hypothetical protein
LQQNRFRTVVGTAPGLRLAIRMLLQQGPVFNNVQDRRAMRRFSLKLPASVRVSGIPTEFSTKTENVSARGLFFYLDRWLNVGARVEVTMSFPPQVTLTNPLNVRFAARVLRVQPVGPSDRVGVAAMIEEYEFLRAEEGAPSSAELTQNYPSQIP